MKLFRTNEIDTDTYQVGDVISFTLTDGENVEAMAVKQEQDGMIFCLVDCLADEYAMNKEDSNRGGYWASDLRDVLNGEILDRVPADLREKLLPFENGDLLRIPTEREISGENIYGETDDKEQWEPMKDRRNRIAFQGSKTGTWEWYWLMNRVKGSAALFALVYDTGYANSYYASYSIGVRPAFKI